MGNEDDRGRFERRQEDQENARWRGGIDARMNAVESDMRDLVKQCSVIDRTVTRMESNVESISREQSSFREELRTAARTIDKGREDAVKKVTDEIAARDAAGVAWKLTMKQLVYGALLAFLLTTISSLIVLAVAGQL